MPARVLLIFQRVLWNPLGTVLKRHEPGARFDTRVGEHDVQAPIPLGRLIECAVQRWPIRHIKHTTVDVISLASKSRFLVLCSLGIHVEDRYPRPVCRENLCE